MEHSYVLPAAAFLADIAVILFLLSNWRGGSGGLDRPLLLLYVCLTGWNLCVALIISAPDAERAWFYLFCLRHFMFLTPPAFLWFALRVTGRTVRWLPAAAFAYAGLFLALAAWTYLSGSRLLIEEIRRYEWGWFPYTAPLARVLLGVLFAGCLLPAFAALIRPRELPAELRGHIRNARLWLPALFVCWWLTLLIAFLPLVGIDLFPPGSGVDAIVGLIIAIYLRGSRNAANASRRSTLLAKLAGMLVSSSFGIVVTFVLLEFLLPAQAIATGLAGAFTAFVALLVFQRWFAHAAGSHVEPKAADDRPLFVILQTRYQLTYQEALICTQLADGVRRAEIVAKLGVTDGTFRNHLSEIYRKTVDQIEAPAERSRDKLQRLTVFLKNLANS